jgi:hypothetical protein
LPTCISSGSSGVADTMVIHLVARTCLVDSSMYAVCWRTQAERGGRWSRGKFLESWGKRRRERASRRSPTMILRLARADTQSSQCATSNFRATSVPLTDPGRAAHHQTCNRPGK